MEPKDIIEIVLFILALITTVGGAIRYLMDRQDKQSTAIYAKMDEKLQTERNERLTQENNMRQSFDNLKDTHVRRDEMNKLELMVSNLGRDVTQRLDLMMQMMTNFITSMSQNNNHKGE